MHACMHASHYLFLLVKINILLRFLEHGRHGSSSTQRGVIRGEGWWSALSGDQQIGQYKKTEMQSDEMISSHEITLRNARHSGISVTDCNHLVRQYKSNMKHHWVLDCYLGEQQPSKYGKWKVKAVREMNAGV